MHGFTARFHSKMEMDVRLLVLTILSASVKAHEDGPKGRETLLSVILQQIVCIGYAQFVSPIKFQSKSNISCSSKITCLALTFACNIYNIETLIKVHDPALVLYKASFNLSLQG